MFLRRLLAEEMVDAEDLLLVEHLVQLLVQCNGTGKVRAEGLFHDDTGAFSQLSLGEELHG